MASCRSCVALQMVSNAPVVPIELDVVVPVSVDHGPVNHLADGERFGHQHGGLVGQADPLQVAVGVEAG